MPDISSSLDGKIYLVPVEANPDLPASLFKQNLLSLETIVSILLEYREDGNHPIIIILDCCRSEIKPSAPRRSDGDPLRGTSGQVGQGANIAILYSTAEGEVAMDESGEGNHSPYTKVFLENLVKGLTLYEINNAITSCLANSGRFSGTQVSHLSPPFGRLFEI